MILGTLLLFLASLTVNSDYIVVDREWMFYKPIHSSVELSQKNINPLTKSDTIEVAKASIDQFAQEGGFLVPAFARCSRDNEMEKYHWQVEFTCWYESIRMNDWLMVDVSDGGEVTVYGFMYRIQSAGKEEDCERVGKDEAEQILKNYFLKKCPELKQEKLNLGLVWHLNPLVKTDKTILRKYWKDNPEGTWDGIANLVSYCDGQIVPESVN